MRAGSQDSNGNFIPDDNVSILYMWLAKVKLTLADGAVRTWSRSGYDRFSKFFKMAEFCECMYACHAG